MRNLLILLSGFILIFTSCKNSPITESQNTAEPFTIVFYNVENLFDTIDAPDKWDEEFTPGSEKNWDTKKYFKKLSNLADVFDSIGTKGLPAIIGLEEVENRAVLEDLVKQEKLAEAHYEIIHYESPDFRGIDNALLYNPQIFTVLHQEAIPVSMPEEIAYRKNQKMTSRDILYVKGLINKKDTLHVLVNHWTSMYYGEEETIPHRAYCASVLRDKINFIFAQNREANIIAGGDFNEDNFGPAVNNVLKADTVLKQFELGQLYSLTNYLNTVKGKGTYSYKGEWGILDHIIVSGSLLQTNNSLFTHKDAIDAFDSDLVLNYYNNKYGKGNRPNRTYAGNRYFGGYSDHLATYIEFNSLP
ncbi:endonuclease [Lentimicrobium sp. L6]|uniref:endonuclease/exonuclease/phosphatase family protein n=1 Tax=Lentimicrobium sp. L6 TaxID=2735916 RepID=UPI0015540156|nr:endonuclease [Lentimicrobium sp. L6]NPD85528.1 endonuclease [Lentimicrobium sp. L6]